MVKDSNQLPFSYRQFFICRVSSCLFWCKNGDRDNPVINCTVQCLSSTDNVHIACMGKQDSCSIGTCCSFHFWPISWEVTSRHITLSYICKLQCFKIVGHSKEAINRLWSVWSCLLKGSLDKPPPLSHPLLLRTHSGMGGSGAKFYS